MTERLIVIGGGGAGISAATTAKRVNPDLKVSLYTEFEDIAYSPCGIPFVHGGEIPRFEDLFLSTVERYVSDGLDMSMETAITDLDLDRGTITARNQHQGFDKLIVATGFVWGSPTRRAPTSRACTTSRTSARRWSSTRSSTRSRRIAVVGATRWRRDGGQPRPPRPRGALHRRGPMGARTRSSTPTSPSPVHESLEERGVTLHLGTRLEAFLGEDHVRAVATSEGEIACDVVIVCLHKVPNTALAAGAGLAAGTTGGLIVDDHMRTAADGV